MERDYWYTSARHLRDLESPEEVGREAARRAVRRLGGRKGDTMEVPVVFDPETAASLVRAMAVASSAPKPLPRYLLSRGPARPVCRVAPRHHRGRSHDAQGARVPVLRRRGAGQPADRAGGPGGAGQLPPRHLQRAAARAHADRARRPRGRGRGDRGVHEPLSRARPVGPGGRSCDPSSGDSTSPS